MQWGKTSLSNRVFKGLLSLSLAGVTLATSQVVTHAQDNSDQSLAEELAPKAASYGYYVDLYKNNVKTNLDPNINPGIGVFQNTFSNYWSGDGIKKNPAILDENVEKTTQITANVSADDALRSYLTDRRDSPYNVISGVGPYADEFIQKSGAHTNYTSLPSSPLPASDKGDDGNTTPWASEDSDLGPVVKLIDLTAKSNFSSSGTPKQYFKYIRPYRQSHQVKVPSVLVDVFAAAPQDDYDFPSGHTTQGFEAGLSLAYIFPQRFQQLVTRSSEIGYDRVLVGRHSPLAVIGGRILGTAVTASVLNDPSNKDLIDQAQSNIQSKLTADGANSQDSYGDYQKNLKAYTERLNYGFEPIGDTNQPMRVPKGAEVLLKTRFPYLSDLQRREVLYTTGISSGYPMTDDTEGWGRLNLFAAGNGFGNFLTNATVNMDAKQGGFNANDIWKNDIGGRGGLTKQGTGSLTLLGNNAYQGDTVIEAGTLVAQNEHALGAGNLNIKAGTLQLSAKKVQVKGQYQESSSGTLETGTGQSLNVSGNAHLNGKLIVDGRQRPTHRQVIFKAARIQGKFKHVQLKGFAKGWHLSYDQHKVVLVKK